MVTLRFVANLLDGTRVSSLQQYGGDYFSFVLIGAGLSLLAYPINEEFRRGRPRRPGYGHIRSDADDARLRR